MVAQKAAGLLGLTNPPDQASLLLLHAKVCRAPPGANYMTRRKVHALVVMQEMPRLAGECRSEFLLDAALAHRMCQCLGATLHRDPDAS